MDFSQFYFFDKTCVLVPRPRQAYSKLLATLQPLQFYSWIAILCMMIIMIGMLSVHGALNEGETSLSFYILTVWSMTLQQYNKQTFTQRGFIMRFTICLYLLVSFILYEAYGGALKSMLAVEIYPEAPNSFEELAKVVLEQNWRVTVCCDFIMFNMGNSSDPYKKAIAKRLELNYLASVDFTKQSFLNASEEKTGHLRNGEVYATVNTYKNMLDAIPRDLLDE